MRSSSLRILGAIAIAVLVWIATPSVSAQPTEFIFQGKLQNGGSAASGDHDFQLVLYDAESGGTQLGATLTRTAVQACVGNLSAMMRSPTRI